MIGHWIVSYESSDSQLEGPEGIEPIEPLVEPESLGFIWSRKVKLKISGTIKRY